MRLTRLAVLGALMLSACGTLPEPFYGNPGPEGARLAAPPAPVLVIPTPTAALLADPSAGLYATDLATALANLGVPSIARPAQPSDWRLTITASIAGTTVTPAYTLTGPDQKLYGKQTGAAIAAADWANGSPAILATAAATDAIPLSRLLAAANAAVQQSNPASLENRPPRLFLTGVSGAPGDGDTALALNLTRDLTNMGLILTPHQRDADFTIAGLVTTTPDTNSQLLLQLTWTIHDASNRMIGQVTQLHDLNPTDISPYWGDVAAAAATQGAAGIQEAINNTILHKTAK